MSVIQSIREKYAKWAVVAIALALLGFILTDYFSTQNRGFGSGAPTTIGSVNGEKIDYNTFQSRLKAMDDQGQAQARQQGREYTEEDRNRNNQQLWNSEVDQVIMSAEYEKLGISVGGKEFNDWLFGPNAPDEMKRNFSDQQGNYDGAAAQNAINQMKRSAKPTEREQLDLFLSALEYNRKLDKFNSLLSKTVYYPKWYIEKKNAEDALVAKVSYVKYAYTKITDSTIKVTDKEIEDYVNKNKDQYQQEDSRSIAYVVFDAAPTSADSAVIRDQLSGLKEQFATATDPAVFLSRFGSAFEYSDEFYPESKILVPAKDSIFKLSKNSIYGPYLDQNSYVLAKLIDVKSMPDSVKARHILIQTFNPQTGQQILDDSTAKRRIDSIDVAIKGGARFDSLASRFSNDTKSAANGGMLANPANELTPYFPAGAMVKEFNDFCFQGSKGEKKVVKTTFGYHLIEIIDQKNFQPNYKVAYFAKNIIAGDETEQKALEEASKFASDSKDLKSFEANIAKSNGKLTKMVATNIKPNDMSIMGINQFGTSRQLVRDIYKADKGDILKQERIGDLRRGYKYVVAAVTDILKKGTQPAYVARQFVERAIKDKKKAEQVKQMLGNLTTLEAAAAQLKDSIVTADSVRFTLRNAQGFDPKVVGAIFNPANKGKLVSEPLAGTRDLYVVRVDEQGTTSVLSGGDIEAQRAKMISDAAPFQTFYANPATILKKVARIKDSRSDFY